MRVVLILCFALAYAHYVTASCHSWSDRFQQHLQGVCVCSITHPCELISNAYLKLGDDSIGVFETSKAGKRLAYSKLDWDKVSSPTGNAEGEVVIETSIKHQEVFGFGGAFTDASAINVYKMHADLQERILKAYFAADGLEYNVGRIPIASCDFSTSVYSYNPVADDFEMDNFSIDVDKMPNSPKLEFILRALNMTSRPIRMFGSSWAPPVWMTRGDYVENCLMKGNPGGPYWKALALYYAKFIEAYEAEGVPIWGMTIQNEPIRQQLATKFWQSLRMTQEDERDFLKLDFGPLIRKKFPHIKIMIMDDQKDEILHWNASIVDADARKYVDGIGVHWYKNVDFVLNPIHGGDFEKLRAFHENNDDIFIMATEACSGYLPEGIGTGSGTKITEPETGWKRGELYARDITNDLANNAVGWTDWNLVLDTFGGPNWAENFVDAPLLVDEEGGKEYYLQPMYYVMGHFSKFLPPGSVRVNCSLAPSNGNENTWRNIDHVAFVTPLNHTVVILHNRNEDDVALRLVDQASQRRKMHKLDANSIQTIIISTQFEPTGKSKESEPPTATGNFASASQVSFPLVLGLMCWCALSLLHTC